MLNVILRPSHNLFCFVTLFIITFFPSTNFSFANEAKDVELFVNNFSNQIITVADDKKLNIDQKRDQVIKIIDGVIDSGWIAKFVLGKNYRQASDEQKDLFKALYRDFVINTYGPKFNGYNGEKFSITSITNDTNYYIAKCIFHSKATTPINIDFRIRKNNDIKISKLNFLIFDIVVEGISLIETQRSEFGAVINKDGLDKFLIDLKDRNEKLKAANKKPGKVDYGGNR